MKKHLQIVKNFFIDIFGWLRSLWIFLFRSIKLPGVFYGYSSYSWACKFADKRSKNWQCNWDQSGKQQGIFPVDEIKLLVCSKMELKTFKNKNIIKSKNFKPRKAIKKSYYTTGL
jgi:hypothetical protein